MSFLFSDMPSRSSFDTRRRNICITVPLRSTLYKGSNVRMFCRRHDSVIKKADSIDYIINVIANLSSTCVNICNLFISSFPFFIVVDNHRTYSLPFPFQIHLFSPFRTIISTPYFRFFSFLSPLLLVSMVCKLFGSAVTYGDTIYYYIKAID